MAQRVAGSGRRGSPPPTARADSVVSRSWARNRSWRFWTITFITAATLIYVGSLEARRAAYAGRLPGLPELSPQQRAIRAHLNEADRAASSLRGARTATADSCAQMQDGAVRACGLCSCPPVPGSQSIPPQKSGKEVRANAQRAHAHGVSTTSAGRVTGRITWITHPTDGGANQRPAELKHQRL